MKYLPFQSNHRDPSPPSVLGHPQEQPNGLAPACAALPNLPNLPNSGLILNPSAPNGKPLISATALSGYGTNPNAANPGPCFTGSGPIQLWQVGFLEDILIEFSNRL